MFVIRPFDLLSLSHRPKGDPLVGVHQGHSAEPGAEPGADQVGGSDGGGVPLPEVGGSGAVMGQEEEQQQHDLRETESGNEVNLLLHKYKTLRLLNVNIRCDRNHEMLSYKCIRVKMSPLREWNS